MPITSSATARVHAPPAPPDSRPLGVFTPAGCTAVEFARFLEAVADAFPGATIANHPSGGYELRIPKESPRG